MRKLLTCLCLGCCVALADPVQWNLSNVTFDDGGAASGFFIVNIDTNPSPDFSYWNVSTTAGSQLGAFDYNIYNSKVRRYFNLDNAIEFVSDATFPSVPNGPDEHRVLILGFSGPLSDAGGMLTLNANQPFSGTSDGSGECLECDPFRTVTGGSIDGGPVTFTTPEPSTVALLPVGLLVLWGCGARFRRRTLGSCVIART